MQSHATAVTASSHHAGLLVDALPVAGLGDGAELEAEAAAELAGDTVQGAVSVIVTSSAPMLSSGTMKPVSPVYVTTWQTLVVCTPVAIGLGATEDEDCAGAGPDDTGLEGAGLGGVELGLGDGAGVVDFGVGEGALELFGVNGAWPAV